MPKKEIISSDKLAPGRGLLSQATRFGNMVFVQGCTGRHPTTNDTGKDIREQTRFTLDRISLILEAAGTSLDNVMTNTCYLARKEDLEGFKLRKRNRHGGRTAIIVEFGAADNLVEITSTACIPG